MQGGGVVSPSLVDITHISKQYQVPGQSGVGFLTGNWDGEWEGVLPNAFASSGPFWLLGGVRMWPSVWMLPPDFWSSRFLDLVATDMETVSINWNSGQVHSVRHKGPCKKIKKWLGLCQPYLFHGELEIHLIATNGLLCRCRGASNLETGTCQPYQTTRLPI